MSLQPTRFYVHYEDCAAFAREVARVGSVESADPANYWETYDARTEGEAISAARNMLRTGVANACQIWARRNLRDVTPAEDPAGLLWDWDEECIGDVEPQP